MGRAPSVAGPQAAPLPKGSWYKLLGNPVSSSKVGPHEAAAGVDFADAL